MSTDDDNFITVCEGFEGTEDRWNKNNVTWYPRIEELLSIIEELDI